MNQENGCNDCSFFDVSESKERNERTLLDGQVKVSEDDYDVLESTDKR